MKTKVRTTSIVLRKIEVDYLSALLHSELQRNAEYIKTAKTAPAMESYVERQVHIRAILDAMRV